MFLGGQLEELDQTKAQRRCPWCIDRARAHGCGAKRGPAVWILWHQCPWFCHVGNTMVMNSCGGNFLTNLPLLISALQPSSVTGVSPSPRSACLWPMVTGAWQSQLLQLIRSMYDRTGYAMYYKYTNTRTKVWYYLWVLGTLCVPNHVDYMCSHVTWFALYQRKFTNSYVAFPKARSYLKAKNLWMDSPNPKLCDRLAPWYCPMSLPSGDITYNMITKLMMALG